MSMNNILMYRSSSKSYVHVLYKHGPLSKTNLIE